MRSIVTTLLVLALPLCAFAHENAVPQVSVPTDAAAIEGPAKVADAFHDALVKGNRSAAEALLDDNVQIFEQGGVERSKAEYAAHHLESDMAFAAATTATQTARSGFVLGDLAYVTTEGKVSGTFKGKAVDSTTLETLVLRRAGSGWRIVHIHWSSRSSKK